MRQSTQRARELRSKPTDAERLLWRAIRQSQLNGYKFTRQFPIGPFIVDFCCRYERLVVEIDGGGHDTQRPYDVSRTEWLARAGYTVLRFWNNEVLGNLEGVIAAISAQLDKKASSVDPPSNSPAR
jgi:very-short-patch-repair endonuclease